MRVRRSFSILLGATALGGAFAVAAQAQEGDAILLDPVAVQARDADGNAADRSTSQYVSDAELERARMGDLKDLFAGVASVSVGGAIPIAQKIFVNGVDMLNLNVTVDGVSQNNRIFHHVSANAFDPGLMKFVRVDAGVAAADAGPNAMAGAVLMETVDARDILLEGQNIGGQARLSFSDNGRTFGRSLTLAGRHGGLEWLASGKVMSGRDYTPGGGGAAIGGTAADLQSGLLKLAYEAEAGHRFTFSAQRMADDSIRRSRANIGDVIGGRPYTPLRRYDTQRDTWSFDYRNTQAAGLWDPRISFGSSQVRVVVDQPDWPIYSPSNGVSQNRNGKIENRFHLSDVNTITAGVDFYSRRSTYRDPVTAPLSETARNLGLYAQARLEPVERLALSFGLRYDRQSFGGVNGWSARVGGFSANASIAYNITDDLKLRAGVSSVFGGITLEDNFLYPDFTTYAGLQPARARNYTLGFDWDAGALRLDGELFVTDVRNARTVTAGAAGNFDFESRGVNLGATYGWDGGFLRSSYSYSKVTVNGGRASSWLAQDYGTPLGGVFALEVQHTPLNSAFTFGGSIQAAQAYRHFNPASADSRPLSGYGVVNLFTEYTPPSLPNLVLRAEVNNLFDKNYSDRATYGGDFNSVNSLREPGRTLNLVASLKF